MLGLFFNRYHSQLLRNQPCHQGTQHRNNPYPRVPYLLGSHGVKSFCFLVQNSNFYSKPVRTKDGYMPPWSNYQQTNKIRTNAEGFFWCSCFNDVQTYHKKKTYSFLLLPIPKILSNLQPKTTITNHTLILNNPIIHNSSCIIHHPNLDNISLYNS